ncbi:MAG: ATP-binding protein [Acidobacteriaceae bacterium]|nr:ATP-binding protein [Acidobacteriaceae bacterium]
MDASDYFDPKQTPSVEAGISEMETRLLWKVSHLISGSMLHNDVIQTALGGVVDSVGCDVALLFLNKQESFELKAMVPSDFDFNLVPSGRYRVEECIWRMAARDGEPVYIFDIASDSRCTYRECKKSEILSVAAIPLKDTEGVQGVLGLASRTARDFSQQAAFLETLAAVISIGLKNSQQHEQVLRHAEKLEKEIEERAKAETESLYSEALLQSFVAKAPYGITRASITQNCILSANPAAVKLLGYDNEAQVQALRLNSDVYWQQQGRSNFLSQLPASGEFKGIEACWKRKDKKLITIRASGRVSRDPESADEGIIEGIIEDVTQQRLLEEQLLQAQKMEAVGRLAGGVAHDFNNLLMVILAQTELLLLELDGTSRRRTEKVVEVAKRAAELTGQLLAFSRKQTTLPTLTTLNKLVTGVSEMVQRLVGENIDVRVSLCDAAWPVMADRSQIKQVIANLVVNARDAMPNGGQLTLQTVNCKLDEAYPINHSIKLSGNYVMLAISDNGTGIPFETQEHIFEPFFTTKEQGKGTGLGLSMVYGIVKHHNGFIRLNSKPGDGATFKIYLPSVDAHEASDNLEESSAVSTAKRSTILLVEDDDNLREVIAEFLRMGGHAVILAEGMETACRVALEHRCKIDLLLTDVVLQDGNGNNLVARLLEQGCTFKVVYMSGYSPKAIVNHGIMNSATRFLQKPFSRIALLELIESTLSSEA